MVNPQLGLTAVWSASRNALANPARVLPLLLGVCVGWGAFSGCSFLKESPSGKAAVLFPLLVPTTGEFKAPEPQIPPTGTPPDNPGSGSPEAPPREASSASEAHPPAPDLFARPLLVVGLAVKQAGMNADPTSASSDAAIFLPKGPRGTDFLTGETVSQTYSPLFNVTSPVTYFGEHPIGFGYTTGLFQVRFTEYLGMYPVRRTAGELHGTFAYFTPTLISTDNREKRWLPWLRFRNEIGLGVTAYQFKGEMTVLRESVFHGVEYQDTYRGPGGVRWGAIIYVELRAYVYERVVLSYSQFLLQTRGYYYYEHNYNLGWGMGWGGT